MVIKMPSLFYGIITVIMLKLIMSIKFNHEYKIQSSFVTTFTCSFSI